MVPSEIELGLAVEREVGMQAGSVERHWELRIEQASYEARRAERRCKAVDPDNRVVARTLEREWEERLQQLDEVQRQRDEAKRQRRVELTDEDRERIRALARDLSRVWRAPSTSQSDRKAMLRLVVEAISLSPIEVPSRSTHVKVAWKTGAVTELQVPRPSSYDRRCTPSAVLDRIPGLAAAGVHDREIVNQLNSAGVLTGAEKPWTLGGVRWLRYHFNIPRTAPDIPRCVPLPERHPDSRYSISGAARLFGVSSNVVRSSIKRGVVHGTIEPYGRFKGAYWLVVDANTILRVRSLNRRLTSHGVGPRGGIVGITAL